MRAVIVAVAVLSSVGYWAYRAAARGTDIPATLVGDIQQGLMDMNKMITGWSIDKVPAEYRAAIVNAENANGLPPGMLARLLYQESHYRQDIITGKTKSPAGAVGIAQFMPDTAAQYGIDPLNAYASIDAAARYLVDISRYLGAGATWADVLASYNWGMGNIKRKGIEAAPPETVAYYTGILTDIGLA